MPNTPKPEAKHTPGPWERDDPNAHLIAGRHADGHYDYVCELWFDGHEGSTPESAEAKLEANAAFILKTCNSHDALVAALKDIADGNINSDFVESIPPDWHKAFSSLQAIARAALAAVQS